MGFLSTSITSTETQVHKTDKRYGRSGSKCLTRKLWSERPVEDFELPIFLSRAESIGRHIIQALMADIGSTHRPPLGEKRKEVQNGGENIIVKFPSPKIWPPYFHNFWLAWQGTRRENNFKVSGKHKRTSIFTKQIWPDLNIWSTIQPPLWDKTRPSVMEVSP